MAAPLTPGLDQRSAINQAAKRTGRRLVNSLIMLPGFHACSRHLARHGLLPERVWCGVPLQKSILIDVAGARFSYEVVGGDYVGMPLYWLGPNAYEPETFALVGRRLVSGSVFFDVGANTGIFSLYAAARDSSVRIWAFEASPKTALQLRRNVALNGFDDRIHTVETAISDKVGTAEFFVPDAVFATSASLAVEGASTSNRVLVPLTTLDEVCERPDVPEPDLVKIDIEGWEERAIAGMYVLLGRRRPDIIVEVLADGPSEALTEALAPHGYRFAKITDQPLSFQDRIEPSETDSCFRNWLCSVRSTIP